MSTLLYHLGHWSAKHKGKVIIGWVLILFLAISTALTTGIKFEEDMSIPGTKSKEALEIVQDEFSNIISDGAQVRMVFKTGESETFETQSVQETLTEILNKIGKIKQVERVTNPLEMGTISENRKIAYTDIVYNVEASKITENSKNELYRIAKQSTNKGIQAEISGLEEDTGFSSISEIIGIIAALFILAFTFTSLLTAGLPILTGIMGLGVGLGIALIGTNIFSISSISFTISIMLGLAVGIDYSLFIISRYRQFITEGNSIKESIARSMATAGNAVIFAGITVMIALAGMSVIGIPFMTTMGLLAAFAIFVVMMVVITLLPALLSLLGKRISPSNKNKLLSALTPKSKETSKDSNKWGRFVTRFPIPILLSGLILTALISWPALDMQLGLPDAGQKPIDTTERKSYDILAEGFGKGINSQLVVLAKTNQSDNPMEDYQKLFANLKKLDSIERVIGPIPTESGEFALFNIQPKGGPNDQNTIDLVHEIRDNAETYKDKFHLQTMVTGNTAVNIEISEKLNEALPLFASIIVGLALVLLTVVFRSILIPIKAVVGYLMTLAATLGFTVLVLQEGHLSSIFGNMEPGPILNFLPIFATGILFGLAMDYEVFLVSRMREEYTRHGNTHNAITSGLKYSGVVVSAAGLIMIMVFGSFIFQENHMIMSVGLALAFGILFDAFVVRMTIVPAVLKLLGKHAWYIPKWLDRILPKVDIEGEKLLAQLEKQDNEKIRKAN